jgi:putative FmdB family regulatory protein
LDIIHDAMPTYEYRCEQGHTFEVVQRMSDPPITVCQIDGGPVERVLHAPAVHFKGSGFYSTDYGSKKRAREMKDSKDSGEGKGKGKDSSNGASESSGSSGSDSKPESKSDSKPDKTASAAKSESK